MGDALRLTVGPDEAGGLIAVVTRGGHPQIDATQDCEVLDVERVRNMKEAKAWFRRVKVEQPWQVRQ